MSAFPALETEAFSAHFADNRALGIHQAGYNGVAELIPRSTGNNLFVSGKAGLNYEYIGLPGLRPYKEVRGPLFETRAEPMNLERDAAGAVHLIQPETSHAHVSARITFSVEQPCYLHQHIELTFHRRFVPAGAPNPFRSMWASYIHAPPDRHVYLQKDPLGSDELSGWVGITKADHTAAAMQIRPLPGDREISADAHLAVMQAQQHSEREADCRLPEMAFELAPMALPASLNGPLDFYYGLARAPQMLLFMFKQPERFRLAYSPNGGGKKPNPNPAWDFALCLADAETGVPYAWDLCLVVKPFVSRADVLAEVRRYQSG